MKMQAKTPMKIQFINIHNTLLHKNMSIRKFSLLTLMVVAALTGSASIPASLKSYLSTPKVDRPALAPAKANVASRTAYGWATRDGSVDRGLVSFDVSAPGTFTSVFPLSGSAFAGCYGTDRYYFYRYTINAAGDDYDQLKFCSINDKTGVVTDIADWSQGGFICNDMTYDYSTGMIYAMCRAIYTDEILNFDIEYSLLLRVNPNSGTYTVVKEYLTDYSGLSNPVYLTLASDLSGRLYTIDVSGNLIYLDKSNDYEATRIGSTGQTPARVLQSMEFDHRNEQLYWCADYSRQVSNFLTINTVTGKGTVIGNLGNDARIAGLYIPFDMPAMSAPAAPGDLRLTPGAQGALQATLSWNNPSTTFGNTTLDRINAVLVYRGDVLIKEFVDATPGAAMTYTDTEVPENGLYEYSVVAINSVGTGKSAVASDWVGRDVPAAVTQLGIARNEDGSVTLTWDAPTQGANMGYFDASTLRYKITRMPDGEVLNEAVTDNEYTDASIEKIDTYYYVVQAINDDGEGESARSAEMFVGNTASFPYECAMANQTEVLSWLAVDNNNDNNTWRYKSVFVSGTGDKGFAQYFESSTNDADDYLISPDFYFRKGCTYTLSFNYKGANDTYVETFDVTVGQGRTAEAQSTVVKHYEIQTGTLTSSGNLQLPAVEESGVYNIAFHATSPKGRYAINIADVKLTESGTPENPDERDEMEAPFNLKADVDDNTGKVVLTWNQEEDEPQPGEDEDGISTDIFDDFESYIPWQINPTGIVQWNYNDVDGGLPFYRYNEWATDVVWPKEACVAVVVNPEQADIEEDDPAYSGKQMLALRGNYSDAEGNTRNAPAPDKYFISPKLNFKESFTFSFYAKSDPDSEEDDPDWKWDKEEIRVGYSTGGMEPDDFTWLSEKNEVIYSGWTRKAYTIPAEARYVCIHYVTPSGAYLLSIDDVFIGTGNPSAAAARLAQARREAAFYYYNVYLDGEKVGRTTGTSYNLGVVAKGEHTATVTAEYNQGESDAATVNFTVNYEAPALKGDVNGDGVVNANDIATTVNVIAGLADSEDYPGADVDGDGVVNANDIAAIVNIIAGTAN